MDTRLRSIAKTATFRLWTILLLILMLWLWFGITVGQSVAYVLTVNVLQTGSYYVHERLWDRVRWGRRSNQKSKK